MDENVKAMYQGFFSGLDAVPAKDPELQKKIDDWKKRMEAFAGTITNIADFYPKYIDSGLSEECTTLMTQLYMQDSNTGNAAPASGEKPVISVKNFLEQYRAAYEEIKQAGYRKHTEKAYENIFAVADRTDNLLEAQIILEQERMLWKIVSEDWCDVYEPIIEASDPLFLSYQSLKLVYQSYLACNSEEEMTYHGQRFERQINILTQRELRPWWFALSIALIAADAAGHRSEFWIWYLKNEHEKAKKKATAALMARDTCRRMLQLLKESYGLTYNDLAADKHVKPFLLAAVNLVLRGRYKKALPPAQLDYYAEIINEQIIPDLGDYEFLMQAARSVYYKKYEAADYDDKILRIANENSGHLTYYKYQEALDKKNEAKDGGDKMDEMMKAFTP